VQKQKHIEVLERIQEDLLPCCALKTWWGAVDGVVNKGVEAK